MKRYLLNLTLLASIMGTVVTSVFIPYHFVVSQTLEAYIERIKPMVVKIDGQEQGTGVIIEKRGNTYTVLTCWHVVNKTDQYTIETSDNQSYQVKKIIQLKISDLALVSFVSNKNYPVASIDNSDNYPVGSTVSYLGYSARIGTKKERTMQVNFPNIIRRISPSDAKDGYQFIINGEAISGLSGSPIFNGSDALVGIYGKTRRDEGTLNNNIYAIPINVAKELAPEVDWSFTPTSILNSNPSSILPLIVAGKYQTNGNYQNVGFAKLINSAFLDDYDKKLVSFNIGSMNLYPYDTYIPFASFSQIEHGRYIYILVHDQLNSTGVIAIDKKYKDDILKYINFNTYVNFNFLVEGYAQKLSNEYNQMIFIEVHRIQIIRND